MRPAISLPLVLHNPSNNCLSHIRTLSPLLFIFLLGIMEGGKYEKGLVAMRRYPFFLLGLVLLLIGGSVLAVPSQQTNPLALDTRVDLETLANAVLGEEQRPASWTGNSDAASPKFVSDLWFDNEQLANSVFGEGIRPSEWLGATSVNAAVLVRNIRHDLELAADEFFGSRSRPPEWIGASGLLRCERNLQNLVTMLRNFYTIDIQTPESALDYCATVTNDVEDSLLNQGIFPSDNEALKDLTLAVRGDLERLADEKLGLDNRPVNWVGNKDRESASLIGDNFLDLESLASQLLGGDQRPLNWVGVVAASPYISYRNMRHDLELLADQTMGDSLRPRGWQGLNPIERCEPLTQDLILITQANYGFTTDTIALENFCQEVANNANLLIENPPIEDVVAQEERSQFLAEAESAFTYLDINASQFMGIMPPGTKFRAWYRNFAASTMMFVSGDDFAVYLDQRWTTLPIDIFDNLPTLEGVAPLTFCDASWCNGPGPTPTPTGSGALALLLNQTTPVAPPSQEEISEKVQVSWNNIRVTYLADNAQTRTAQVALEICVEPAQITCEPIIRVFDNAVGAAKPVLSQSPNGLNVYEFPYGYSSNLLIEGTTLTSPDVWISDPSIR